MKKVKVLSTAFMGAMAAIALASCGGNKSSKNTITIYAPVGDTLKGFLENAIKVFNKDNPNWKVEINTSFSGSYDNVKSSVINDLNVGNQPAIAYCYPDHVAQYLKTGKVINIQKYIDDEKVGYTKAEWEDFVPAYMQEGTSFSVEGRYTVPMARSSEVMFYNKTVLEKHNIAVPETWDQLWAACSQLKTLYPKSVPLGYDSSANWIISHLEEQGAIDGAKYYTDGSKPGKEKIVFNNQKTIDFLTELRAKYKEGLFTTKDVSGTNSSNNFKTYDPNPKNEANFNGHFFSIGSTGGASYQVPNTHDENGTTVPNFRAEIAKNPHLAGTTLKCISQGPSLVLLDQGNEDKNLAVWKLVKCFLAKECQIEYSIESGYMPIRKSVYNDDTFKAKLTVDDSTTDKRRLINTCISMGNELTENLYTSDTFVGSDKARVELGTLMINIMKGKDSATLVKDQIDKSEANVKYFVK